MTTRDQAQPQRLVDEVKAGPGGAMTDADRRALSPLLWMHVNPYGRFRVDVYRRLDLDLTARAAAVPAPRPPEDEPVAAPA
ncbi:hypothetical protein ACFU93_18385 [Streptomyces sp. NPDC057611]|uniref:hypothetical protein n=1 Tax=Streptomyces sp. NPDC057611 TaxID=3346182 RepID=UPI0036D13968